MASKALSLKATMLRTKAGRQKCAVMPLHVFEAFLGRALTPPSPYMPMSPVRGRKGALLLDGLQPLARQLVLLHLLLEHARDALNASDDEAPRYRSSNEGRRTTCP